MDKKNLRFYNKNKKIHTIVYVILERNGVLEKIPQELRDMFETFKSDETIKELSEKEKKDARDIIQYFYNRYIYEDEEIRNAWLKESIEMQEKLQYDAQKALEDVLKIEKEKTSCFEIDDLPTKIPKDKKRILADNRNRNPDRYYPPAWYWDEKEGVLKFLRIDNSQRAKDQNRKSDLQNFTAETMAKYANVALEFFGYRCAFSGERFTIFENPTANGVRTNLSVEHVLAISKGGDDIVGNILATSLPYNISKNDDYALNWWPCVKNGDGDFIYSKERLLKVTYFMLKTLQMREQIEKGGEAFIEEYKDELFRKDSILEYIQEIEDNDILSEDTSSKLILSDYVTNTEKAYTDGVQQKYSLESVELDAFPNRTITTLRPNINPSLKYFLLDAVAILERDLALEEDKKNTIISLLNKMKKSVIQNLDNKTHQQIVIEEELHKFFEENNLISKEDRELIIESLCNTETWGEDISKIKDEEIRNIISRKLNNQYSLCKEKFGENVNDIILARPRLLYDEKFVDRVLFWKENRNDFADLLQRQETELDELIDVMIVLKKNGIKFDKKRMEKTIIGDKESRDGLLYKNDNAEKIIKELEMILEGGNCKEYPINNKIRDMRTNEDKKILVYMVIEDYINKTEEAALFGKIDKKDKSEIKNLINTLLYLKLEFGIDFEKIKQKTTIDRLLKNDEDRKKAKVYIQNLTGDENSSILNIGMTLYNKKQYHYKDFIDTLYTILRVRKLEDKDFSIDPKDIELLKKDINLKSPWRQTVHYKVQKGSNLKIYRVRNLDETKDADDAIRNLSLKTDWLKGELTDEVKKKLKDNSKRKDGKEIDRWIDNITQMSVFIADNCAVDKIENETGRKLDIEDEKYLLYFLMDQQLHFLMNPKQYSDLSKIEIFSEGEINKLEAIFDYSIKKLKNNPEINTKYIDKITGEEKEKDIIQLLREYYRKIIHEKIIKADNEKYDKKIISEDNERD